MLTSYEKTVFNNFTKRTISFILFRNNFDKLFLFSKNYHLFLLQLIQS